MNYSFACIIFQSSLKTTYGRTMVSLGTSEFLKFSSKTYYSNCNYILVITSLFFVLHAERIKFDIGLILQYQLGRKLLYGAHRWKFYASKS
jgi:hypothetical protein